MNLPKQKPAPPLDAVLKHILVNRKPMSVARLRWWFVIMLTRLFGRKVRIEGGDGRLLRLFPVIWGNKLYLLGSEHEYLQIDYTSPYTLRLTKAPMVSVGPGAPVVAESSARTSCVHVVLCHLPPEKTDRILDYLHKLRGSNELVLAYGGTATNFEGVRFPRKVFIADDKLRGAAYRQSYFGLMQTVQGYLRECAIEAEWIFMSDYDLVPFQPNYPDALISLMKKHEAGFGGKFIRDASLSNSLFLTNAINDGVIAGVPAFGRPERKPIYHCLGACVCFHHTCFDAVLELKDALNDMYFELALPTAANLKGFRVISFDAHSKVLEHVRYRPIYSRAEALQLAAAGAEFVHPLKEISEFLEEKSEQRIPKQ